MRSKALQGRQAAQTSSSLDMRGRKQHFEAILGTRCIVSKGLFGAGSELSGCKTSDRLQDTIELVLLQWLQYSLLLMRANVSASAELKVLTKMRGTRKDISDGTCQDSIVILPFLFLFQGVKMGDTFITTCNV